MKRQGMLPLMLILFGTGCSSHRAADQEIVQEIGRIPLMETVPDTVLAGVADYLITPSGVRCLADPRLCHLILLDENWHLIRTIGRRGQGPGEFQWPYRLALVNDSLMVWDRLNGRLESFTRDGRYLDMIRPEAPVTANFPVVLTDDGRLMVSTYGIGVEYLLRVFDRRLRAFSPLGTLEAPPATGHLMGLSESDARSRTIPDELKNRAFAVPAGDGGVFLIHTAVPVFKKYDRSGTELWRREHDHPRLRAICEEAFEQTLQETGNRAYSPNFWRGGAGDGEGGCFLQLSGTDRVILFHLHADGALGEPLAGPEGNWGYLRRYLGHLWLLDTETLELMQLQVERGARGSGEVR